MTSPSTHNDRSSKEASRSPRVIKRYANRKLYDTRDSRYVTLLQIAEYVRQGEDVSIIDNTTKEDLTNITLAQIVYEEERKSGDEARRGAGTMSTLRGLIQQSGERLMSSLREGPVGKLIARREDGTPEPEIVVPPPAPPEPVAQSDGGKADGAAGKADTGKVDASKAERRLMSPKEAFDELQRLADDRIRSVLGVAIGHVHNLQNEVKGLQARIEDLEQKLVAAQKRRDHETDGKDAKDAKDA